LADSIEILDKTKALQVEGQDVQPIDEYSLLVVPKPDEGCNMIALNHFQARRKSSAAGQ
jgi:hypothetical protein